MKAILVIDLDDENISHYGVSVYHYTSRQFVHIDAPLKPMPEKKEAKIVGFNTTDYVEHKLFAEGWNACLDEITGETE